MSSRGAYSLIESASVDLIYVSPAASSSRKETLAVWSSLRTGQTTGMLGVSFPPCDRRRELILVPDVEIHHLETARQLKFSDISIVSRGPLRAAIKAKLKYHNSDIQVLVC